MRSPAPKGPGEAVGGASARVTVPDFVGLSLGQAIRAARRSSVELAFDVPTARDRYRPAPATGAGPGAGGGGLSRGVRTPRMTNATSTLGAL